MSLQRNYLNTLKSEREKHCFTHVSIMTTMRADKVNTDGSDSHGRTTLKYMIV
jgi:hypothetical protein